MRPLFTSQDDGPNPRPTMHEQIALTSALALRRVTSRYLLSAFGDKHTADAIARVGRNVYANHTPPAEAE